VLVLAYHVIGRVAREHDPHNLAVTPEAFAAQVETLRGRGWAFVPMSELRAGRKVCALTFDDGARDELPSVLSALGVPATLYVCPGLLGEPHPFLAPESGVRLMTHEELVALQSVELASHTLRHTVLADASREAALREMVDSKAALEAISGKPVTSFAYPECGYSPACPDAAREAGYATAVTCGSRGSLAPYELRRVAIDSLENRLTWALKSRDLWRHVFDSRAGRAGRRVARPFRHGMLR
jgi:peptidoglycan/xylan/chitin deacetylase (PgdA/CDA1 family)